MLYQTIMDVKHDTLKNIIGPEKYHWLLKDACHFCGGEETCVCAERKQFEVIIYKYESN